MLKLNEEQIKTTIIFLIGLSLGWLFCLMIGQTKIEHQIGYVAKDEILKLEKERVAQNKEESLFKGNKNVPEILSKIAKKFENNDFSIIFSNSAVGGTNVISLSQKMHEEVIRQLEQQGEDKMDENNK